MLNECQDHSVHSLTLGRPVRAWCVGWQKSACQQCWVEKHILNLNMASTLIFLFFKANTTLSMLLVFLYHAHSNCPCAEVGRWNKGYEIHTWALIQTQPHGCEHRHRLCPCPLPVFNGQLSVVKRQLKALITPKDCRYRITFSAYYNPFYRHSQRKLCYE
jgi:hypothetical protein